MAQVVLRYSVNEVLRLVEEDAKLRMAAGNGFDINTNPSSVHATLHLPIKVFSSEVCVTVARLDGKDIDDCNG